MSAYAPHYTARYKQRYAVQGANHSITFRFPGPSSGSGLTDAQNAFGELMVALGPITFVDWTLGQASSADVDSTVFLPVLAVGAPSGAIAIDAREGEEKATALTFVARSAGGNPWKFSYFGAAISGLEDAGGVDYRIRPGEVAAIDAAVLVLQTNASAFVGNDSTPLFWYTYVNYKDYDHWVKEVRG